MKIKALIFFSFLFFACTKNEAENKIENLLNKMEQRLNAESSTMLEQDENMRGQGVKRVLNIEFLGCKKIDLMDNALKGEINALAQELKNNIEGSERIEKYKFILKKDPTDATPSKSGLNINEKGFTVGRENLK